MKITATLLVACAWTGATAAAAKARIVANSLRLKNTGAHPFELNGHMGTYGLLLPARSADS